jgi:hypothetical protein
MVAWHMAQSLDGLMFEGAMEALVPCAYGTSTALRLATLLRVALRCLGVALALLALALLAYFTETANAHDARQNNPTHIVLMSVIGVRVIQLIHYVYSIDAFAQSPTELTT